MAVNNLSQCSPVWKTGTIQRIPARGASATASSQCSPVWKTGTMLQLVWMVVFTSAVSM